MQRLDMKLSIVNMGPVPTVFGFGADRGVHLYHRYGQEGAGSFLAVLTVTGDAVLTNGVTTALAALPALVRIAAGPTQPTGLPGGSAGKTAADGTLG